MPDFKRTQKIFEEQDLMKFWKKPAELLDNEGYEKKVINPDTETYTQTADLPVEYRKFNDGRIYPIRQVLHIKRIKIVDGSEWLKSSGRITGLSKTGDEVYHSFTDSEVFYKPITRHAFKKKEPNNEYSPTERVCVEAGFNPNEYQYTEYTLPFNENNFDNLYNQKPTKDSSSVSLVIYAEGASDKPRLITNVDQFRNKPFDDLWTEATTPKFKLDRSFKDNLEDRHIG